jgi:hypothetical protein
MILSRSCPKQRCRTWVAAVGVEVVDHLLQLRPHQVPRDPPGLLDQAFLVPQALVVRQRAHLVPACQQARHHHVQTCRQAPPDLPVLPRVHLDLLEHQQAHLVHLVPQACPGLQARRDESLMTACNAVSFHVLIHSPIHNRVCRCCNGKLIANQGWRSTVIRL